MYSSFRFKLASGGPFFSWPINTMRESDRGQESKETKRQLWDPEDAASDCPDDCNKAIQALSGVLSGQWKKTLIEPALETVRKTQEDREEASPLSKRQIEKKASDEDRICQEVLRQSPDLAPDLLPDQGLAPAPDLLADLAQDPTSTTYVLVQPEEEWVDLLEQEKEALAKKDL